MGDFDQYLRQGEAAEPGKRAAAWQTAIGLQDVDGLLPSEYLVQTARSNIEGNITIAETLDYDFAQERGFDYAALAADEAIAHLGAFIAGIWQIHPFSEGNTRTTAVFLIEYLRRLGFRVGNDPFASHSRHFRNALVRANYVDREKGIRPTQEFLGLFLRNLVLVEKNALHNRYLHVSQAGHLSRENGRRNGRWVVKE